VRFGEKSGHVDVTPQESMHGASSLVVSDDLAAFVDVARDATEAETEVGHGAVLPEERAAERSSADVLAGADDLAVIVDRQRVTPVADAGALQAGIVGSCLPPAADDRHDQARRLENHRGNNEREDGRGGYPHDLPVWPQSGHFPASSACAALGVHGGRHS
jgi:hypothetical protein